MTTTRIRIADESGIAFALQEARKVADSIGFEKGLITSLDEVTARKIIMPTTSELAIEIPLSRCDITRHPVGF